MDQFLCPVCQLRLEQPVTLSCGYTVCRHCIHPCSNSDNMTVFVCPVRYCRKSTHLFSRSQVFHTDSVVDRLLKCGASTTNSNKGTLPLMLNDKAEISRCRKCNDTLYDPVTNHCGHVFCRTCILILKIEATSCPICQEPLPRYNYILYQAAPNRLLQYHLGSSINWKQKYPIVHPSSNGCLTLPAPMFVTGLVILPLQHVRIPVFATAHMRMLRRAIFRSGSSLFLPAIHRGRPSMAEYGTIVEIIGVEQRSEDTIILDVMGKDRFRVTMTPEIDGSDNDDMIAAVYHRFPATAEIQQPSDIAATVAADAHAIHTFLCQLAGTQPPADILSTSTAGLLGPSWLDRMEKMHGCLPPPHRPDALGWWAASVLPVSSQERYSLLRAESLQDRLHMVMLWIRALSAQWHSVRQTAIDSYSNVFSLQPPPVQHSTTL